VTPGGVAAILAIDIHHPRHEVTMSSRLRGGAMRALPVCLAIGAWTNQPARAFELVPGHFYTTDRFSTHQISEYDQAGAFVDQIVVPGPHVASGDDLRGLAVGPDGRLYVAVDRGPHVPFRVLVIGATGSVEQIYQHSSRTIWGNTAYGKVSFEDDGRFFVMGPHINEFDSRTSAELRTLLGSYRDAAELPNGNFLTIRNAEILEIAASGTSIVREIEVSDPNGVSGASHFFVNGMQGLEIDPANGDLLVTMNGFTGQNSRLMRIDAATGELRAIATHLSPTDLFLTRDGRLAVASNSAAPGLFDLDFNLVGSLGSRPDQFFVTQFAPAEPPRIDILPGHEQNWIFPASNLPIPVALFGSDAFDVRDVVVATLAFGPGGAAPWRGNAWYRDVDGDEHEDLVARFRVREAGLAIGDTEACLTGETVSGDSFTGCDAIRTFPRCGRGYEAALVVPLLALGRRRKR
jgi:DNA-binding beta-propeller fold protein YncE